MQIRIVLAWEAPPRRFFTWWCGGMSVRDLIVVIFMVAANLWYFIWYYRSYDRQLDAGGLGSGERGDVPHCGVLLLAVQPARL